MLYEEMDVMDYMLTMETEMLDDDLLINEVMTEAEADEFIDWLYDDTDVFDISTSELWKLCNSEITANFSTLKLTVYDDDFNTVFSGIAMNYPYDWFDCRIDDYSFYNVGNSTHLDVWAHFDTWK